MYLLLVANIFGLTYIGGMEFPEYLKVAVKKKLGSFANRYCRVRGYIYMTCSEIFDHRMGYSILHWEDCFVACFLMSVRSMTRMNNGDIAE